MLKFPSAAKRNPDMSCSNSCFSEYLGCIFEMPTSAIMLDGRRVKYYDFISSLQNEDCNAALRRIAPRVDLVKINALVDETPALTDLQRQFYKTMLTERKRKLLDLPLGKLENSK